MGRMQIVRAEACVCLWRQMLAVDSLRRTCGMANPRPLVRQTVDREQRRSLAS
jgi:hypothetical protein